MGRRPSQGREGRGLPTASAAGAGRLARSSARASAAPSRSSQARKGSRKKPAEGWLAVAKAASAKLAASAAVTIASAAAAAEAPEAGERERKEQVELLLDAEAPGVEERQGLGARAEIVELEPVEDVGHRQGGGDEAAGKFLELEGRHPGDGKRDAGEEHGGERGQDAAGPALVEAGEGEAALAQVTSEDAGDQIAGDDEEDVDAEIAARKGGQAGVKEDDRQHRHRAQAIDLAPVGMSGSRRDLGPGGHIGYRCQTRLASDRRVSLTMVRPRQSSKHVWPWASKRHFSGLSGLPCQLDDFGGDGKVLQADAGAVEERDLVRRAAAGVGAGDHLRRWA